MDEENEVRDVRPGDEVNLMLFEKGYETAISGTVISVIREDWLDLDQLALEGSEIGYVYMSKTLIELAGVEGYIDVSGAKLERIN